MLPRIFLTVACVIAFAYTSRGQEPAMQVYRPKDAYATSELLPGFEKRKDAVVRTTKNQRLKAFYVANFKQLKRYADAEIFLNDKEAEALIHEVTNKVVDANPQLKRKPQQVLILRTPEVNALCFGEGTFAITTGMLSRIDSEPVLAYVLCHEFSHYELDHRSKGIEDDVDKETSKKIRKGVEKIAVADDNVTSGDIDSLKKWVYETKHFQREREAEADSLGLIMLLRAGYYGGSALTAFTLLDSANVPKHHLGDLLHDSFNSIKVPFQDYWMSPRLSHFENFNLTLFFSEDSLKSHPDLPLRRKKLIGYLKSNEELQLGKTSMFWNADLENLEAALLHRRYDAALLIALTTIPEMPAHSAYLKGIVAKILIDVYSVKDTPLMSQYVPTYISGYPKDLKTVNAFLHNIHKSELGELAFDYINRKGNFDMSVEFHYYQLWRICNFTGRDELKTRVKKTYRDRFGKGEYYDRMDNQLQIALPNGSKVNRGYN